ncbi:MAG TPA: redoxin domain-containing protein [Dehalococcoidia bacterium]|jgi:peroxiredoxin (alkyl hydroperoxide reductase subunit C)|nr:redoxin domain-containing protein [Dehalococcoidia bacterium]
MPAVVGQPAPDFKLKDQNNNDVSLADLKGSKTIIAFIPFPHTGICDSEACALRDDYSSLSADGSKVVIISAHARPLLAVWAQQNNLQFPVLSDFWPHGATAQAYGCFNETVGVAMRASYVLDKDGIVRQIIQTESLGQARDHTQYAPALASA